MYTPTLFGNNDGDSKSIGLNKAIDSLVTFIETNNIQNCILVGHSYGEMVITGAFDRLDESRVKRLVYWSAFVPNPGEALADMVPPHYAELFKSIVAEDGSVLLPFPIYRESFINDADIELAESSYAKLNPHPHKTITYPIQLSKAPSEMEVGKSYLVCQDDIALPASLPWHPRLSEKLGLYRLVTMPCSHEGCFTNPTLLGVEMIETGRD